MKIIVYDGINGISLGKDLFSELIELSGEGLYLESNNFNYKLFYKYRSALVRLKNKSETKNGFYNLPRLNENQLINRIKSENPDVILVIGFIYKFLSPQKLKNL